jgi:hypothetical protein
VETRTGRGVFLGKERRSHSGERKIAGG